MKNTRVDGNITRSFGSFAKRLGLGLAVAGGLLALAGTVKAQLLYSQNFETDDSANWVVLTDTLGASHAVDFNFDYSTIGIPAAPHSTGGTTHGLKLMININPLTQLGSTVTVGESVSPTNFSISQNFDMHVDMWANYHGPNDGPGGANFTKGGSATNHFTTLTGFTSASGGSGSTILWGCGYGTAGSSAQYAGHADSIYVGVSGDDGTAAEVRMYAPGQASSYQDGVYQISGTSTPNPGGDFFVYNNATGSRNFRQISNASAPGWTNHFWATKPPQAQIDNWLQQSNIVCRPGTTGFAWHDVEVQKIGNVIVYSIDGFIAGTANTASAGNPAGTYLTFLGSDINGNASLDPNFTNLNFVVFDNITISNYANVVQVTATQGNASEAGPTPGTFTITRTSAGVPLTVNYTMSGTATNGVNYQTLSGSVTFNNIDLSTNITLTPIDDGVPEATMGAVLSITASPNYVGAGSATVYIADNDTPTLDITCTRGQAYDRYDVSTVNPDFILYHMTRRGQLSPALSANVSYSGTAVGGTDYAPSNSIPIAGGVQEVDFAVYPIRNPAVTGDQTVTVGVASGSGYAIGNGPATGTIIDSDYAAAPVLLSDALTDPNDATNWFITYGTGDPTNNAANFNVDFGFSLSAAFGAAVPPPPGGAGSALHATCNKNVSPGAPGAVNAYYTNLVLSGNYAVRFSMNLIEGDTVSSATEGAVFGINHTGSQSNWWWGSGTITTNTWGSDGIWYFVSAQALGNISGDYQELTGLGGTNGNAGWTRLATQVTTTFTNAFKNTPGPFTTIDNNGGFSSGTPANAPPIAYDASTWADVEIKQINNVITLSINKTRIFTYTNTTVWTSGYLMLGYEDPYGGSVESADASVYYANLEVVQLPVVTTVTINNIAISAGNVVITFTTSNPSDTTSSFTLQSSGTVSGTYGNVSPPATITSLGSNQFQASTPYNGGTQFYRIKHN